MAFYCITLPLAALRVCTLTDVTMGHILSFDQNKNGKSGEIFFTQWTLKASNSDLSQKEKGLFLKKAIRTHAAVWLREPRRGISSLTRKKKKKGQGSEETTSPLLWFFFSFYTPCFLSVFHRSFAAFRCSANGPSRSGAQRPIAEQRAVGGWGWGVAAAKVG